jgi:glycosyltransferase involved in cell wall biosynthesis
LYRRLAAKGISEILVLTDVAAAGEVLPGLEVRPLLTRWSLWEVPELIKACRKFRPDIVHIQYPSIKYKRHLMPSLLPLILKGTGVGSVIITLHGFGLYTWLGKLRLSLAAVSADGIIPVSGHIRNTAEKFWGHAGQSISARLEEVVFTGSSIELTSGITAQQRRALRESWGMGPGQIALAYFGFINDGKGFDDLLQSYRVCLDRGLDARLICLSSLDPVGDKYQLEMQRTINRLGLETRLHFTGYLDSEAVASALAAADMAVLPFNYGASTKRTTLLAALACGCPVITTSDPSLPLFFKNEENILLVPPRDPANLAQAILRLGRDRKLRDLIRAGTAELTGHFSWDSIADKHMQIYRRHLKESRKNGNH